MTKYLFLLGFSLFSINFLLSTSVIADYYDTGEVHTGVVYQNNSDSAIHCDNVEGLKKRIEALNNKREKHVPQECDQGGFSKFVFFEIIAIEKGYMHVRSFISDGDKEWRETYIEVKATIDLVSCDKSEAFNITNNNTWKEDCNDNLAMYRRYKYQQGDNILGDSHQALKRSPDSIKE